MNEQSYVIAKALRLWRTAAERAAKARAEKAALDALLWPAKPKKVKS